MSTRKPDDFDREIASHLELEVERLIEEGLTPEDARRAARRRFGNVTAARERYYEAGRLLWLDRLLQDVRGALRSIRRYPVAATVAVVSLAAGIGATTATLTVRDVAFRKPPPEIHEAALVSRIQVGRPDRPIRPIGSYVPRALYAIWSDTFGPAIAASMPRGAGAREVRTNDRADTVPLRAVTSEFFSVLGVRLQQGRTFSGSRPRRGDPVPAVLSHRVWQRLFDGRPDAIGEVVWIENEPHTVIGILPERFWFSEMDSPIWTLLDLESLAPGDGLDVIIRRSRDVTTAMLDARLQSGLAGYATGLPAAERQLQLKISGIEGTPLGNEMSFILPYLLGTSVLLTLLIACANVAILMIAQWTARRHEIAIRASIGASRGRLVRLLLTESVLIAACGGALGVCATFAIRGWIIRRGGPDIAFFDLAIEPGVLVRTALITLVTGIAAGVMPALYETRQLHTNPLSAMARSDLRQRWRHALVVLEIAVTVALLVETTAMVDAYQRIKRAPMGFPTRPLMSAQVENPAGVPTGQVLDVLNQLPGVASAAASTSIPYIASGRRESVATDAAGSNAVPTESGQITAGFFSGLGVPMRTGRAFTDQDSAATRTAIVNEALARRLFQDHDPIGARIWISQTPYDIVGVVANYASNPLRPATFDSRVFFPLPLDAKDVKRRAFLIRADADPAALVRTVHREVRDKAPGTVVTNAVTFDQIITVIGQEMLGATAPFFPLISIGMLLTAAGIYGVLAFAVTHRSRELALRVAIGASGRDIVRLVSAHAFRLVVTGAVLGIALMFGLSRIVRAGGGAGSILDPTLYAFVAPVVIVLAIGVIATWIPSRRALKINPATLLRMT